MERVVTAQLFVWSQTIMDDIKGDPCQRHLSYIPYEEEEEGEIIIQSREMTRREVEDALNQEGVSGEKKEKILKVLFSTRFSFNRATKEETQGIKFEIPEAADQDRDIKMRFTPWHHLVRIPLAGKPAE